MALENESFECQLDLAVRDWSGCSKASLSLHFGEGSPLPLTWGRNGSSASGVLQPKGTPPKYAMQAGDALWLPIEGDCFLKGVHLNELSLLALDLDNDGHADEIDAHGSSSEHVLDGDVWQTVELELNLVGVKDRVPPTLLPATDLHPLDPLRLEASEPVARSSRVTLEVGNQSFELTGAGVGVDAFESFESDVILPFGATITANATGADLAGLPFESPVSIKTWSDPGLLALYDFESVSSERLLSVTSVGAIPAIEGNRSLWVEPQQSATLHLARPAGANRVRLQARTFSGVNGTPLESPSIEVGVVGGRLRNRVELLAATSVETSDTNWKFASPLEDFEVPITEAGDELVVRVQSRACPAYCPGRAAVLIDNVRAE